MIPLPPPYPSLSNTYLTKFDPKKIRLRNIEENQQFISHLCQLNQSFLSFKENDILLSHYNNSISVIQEGPTCGLAVAKIAIKLLHGEKSFTYQNDSIQDLLLLAKKMNFTRYGEMYSTKNLGILLQSFGNIKYNIVTNLMNKKLEIIEHIIKGWPILICYDADANHHPCLKKGHRSHWAIILGFIIVIQNFSHENMHILKYFKNDDHLRCLFHLIKDKDNENLLQIINSLPKKQLFVYVKQGKSSNVLIFSYDELIRSNLNLMKISENEKRDFILPDSIKEALSNQSLFLMPS